MSRSDDPRTFLHKCHVYSLQYKDTPFRMLTGDGEVVVLPTKYLEELKHLPPSILSSFEAQFEVLLQVNFMLKICAQFPDQLELDCTGRLYKSFDKQSPTISNSQTMSDPSTA
jgi:hypothetical protein